MSDEVAGSARTGRAGRSGGHRLRGGFEFAVFRARLFGTLATIVRWVCTVAAALLAVHVLLTVAGANPANALVRFVADWAETLAFGFRDLFVKPRAPKLQVLLNHGSAAVCWLLVSAVAGRLLRLFGGRAG
ncbi:hypothetical protein [Actinopolyspora mortivallis]|uniref:Uncharacterized protein n=1 Tax=Actinopolyspora mortivallis TaxID=33906 RepID=A0A2T0GW87_ACTMO|nr:hypothetical protein [Actinopolyspora mortivallis]PRW63364.1 hypothetical protein CEP50_10425 [Actinopolyspora mortivallis]